MQVKPPGSIRAGRVPREDIGIPVIVGSRFADDKKLRHGKFCPCRVFNIVGKYL
jgi:hypothetical protein